MNKLVTQNTSSDNSKGDEEVIQNLELLLDLDLLEQSDSWEMVMNLAEFESPIVDEDTEKKEK